MNLWRSMAGMVEAELTVADPEAILNALNKASIPVFSVCRKDELTLRFQIARSDYRKLKQLTDKRGEVIKLSKRTGFYWLLKSLHKRPLFLLGQILFFLIVLLLPTRIFFVQVEGNHLVPERKIVEAAKISGIHFGASGRAVRSEQVKNTLLAMLPELEWAGVNTRGTLAVVSVRERAEIQDATPAYPVSSVVAARDGVIESCTATAGNLLCTPGQAVKKGQVLISAYTDCGTHLQASRAEGEIYGITKRTFHAVSLRDGRIRLRERECKRKFGLIIGKKRINFWNDSGISDMTCDRIYAEYYITLPGGFVLPIAFTVDTYVLWETAESSFGDAALSNFARTSLRDQMIAGEILDYKEESQTERGVQILSGTYICREMIGREKPEQMGEDYVEND